MLGRYFFDKTERGIDFVWMQHDREKILEGRHLLTEASEEGDADALCFLSRTYMGAQYVWQYSGLDEDDDRAEKAGAREHSKGQCVRRIDRDAARCTHAV